MSTGSKQDKPSARAEILGRLDSIFESRAPEFESPEYARDPSRTVPESGRERLLSRLADQRVGHHLVAGPKALLDLLANRIYSNGWQRIVVDEESMPPGVELLAGLKERLLDVDVRAVADVDTAFIASAELGLTGCRAVAVETGSVVIQGDTAARLQASLLPGIHYCIGTTEQVVPDLHTWLAQTPSPEDHVVIVSGPSRTADIEKQVVIGVHGPWQFSLYLLTSVPRPKGGESGT